MSTPIDQPMRVRLICNGALLLDTGFQRSMDVEWNVDRQVLEEDRVARFWGGERVRRIVAPPERIDATLTVSTPGAVPVAKPMPDGLVRRDDMVRVELGPDGVPRIVVGGGGGGGYGGGGGGGGSSSAEEQMLRRELAVTRTKLKQAEAKLARAEAKLARYVAEEQLREQDRRKRPPNGVREIILPGIHDEVPKPADDDDDDDDDDEW